MESTEGTKEGREKEGMAFKALEDDLSSEDESASSSRSAEGEGGAGGEEEVEARKRAGADKAKDGEKKKKKGLTAEDLKRFGYGGGPSVLLVPENDGEENWAWSNGREHGKALRAAAPGERAEVRDGNRGAANERTEAAVKQSLEQSERLKKIKKDERASQRRAKRAGFGYNESRKKGKVDERQ